MTKEGHPKRAEFDVPAAATADGALTLTWRQEPGAGGAGRGNQIAEVWLHEDDDRLDAVVSGGKASAD